jgi:hypothetical protein
LIIGGEDQELIENEKVAKAKLTSDEGFLINLDKITMNGMEIVKNKEALVDTGNTLISFPLEYREKFSKQLEKMGVSCDLYSEYNEEFFQLGCNFKKDMSDSFDLEFVIGGVELKLNAMHLIDVCNEIPNNPDQINCLYLIEFQKDGPFFMLGNLDLNL